MHKRITINSSSNHLLYISTSLIDDGFLTSLHSHPNLEILLITEGEGTIVTTNRRLPVKAHDIVIINPNSKHCEIGDGLRFYAIGIRDTEVFHKDTFTKKIIINMLNDYDFHSVIGLYNLMYDEARKNQTTSEKIINSCYDILYTLLNRSYKIIKNDSVQESESDLVSSIKAIIDNYYYSNEITLDELSHRLSISKSTLCHEFKKQTGQSIIDYKISKELEESCNLLSISDMSISDIAYQVGFTDAAYFSKIFKKKYGLTPKKYKEQR